MSIVSPPCIQNFGKRSGTILVFWGALLRIFFSPLPGPEPGFCNFSSKKKNKLVGGDCSHHCAIPCSPKTVYLLTVCFCIWGTHGLVCIMLCAGNRFGNESQHATLMSPLTFIDSPTLGAWSAGCWASLNTC